MSHVGSSECSSPDCACHAALRRTAPAPSDSRVTVDQILDAIRDVFPGDFDAYAERAWRKAAQAVAALVAAAPHEPRRGCRFVEASPDPTLHLHDSFMYVGKCDGNPQSPQTVEEFAATPPRAEMVTVPFAEWHELREDSRKLKRLSYQADNTVPQEPGRPFPAQPDGLCTNFRMAVILEGAHLVHVNSGAMQCALYAESTAQVAQ
jgi:hypothetical protein